MTNHKPTCDCATEYYTARDSDGVMTLWQKRPGKRAVPLADQDTTLPDVWRLLTESNDVQHGNMRRSLGRLSAQVGRLGSKS